LCLGRYDSNLESTEEESSAESKSKAGSSSSESESESGSEKAAAERPAKSKPKPKEGTESSDVSDVSESESEEKKPAKKHKEKEPKKKRKVRKEIWDLFYCHLNAKSVKPCCDNVSIYYANIYLLIYIITVCVPVLLIQQPNSKNILRQNLRQKSYDHF